jgi:hypothetical protein
MPSTWLLTVALAAASPAGQEIAFPQTQSTSTPARPPESKNPFTRLFKTAPSDPVVKPGLVPLFPTQPAKPAIGAHDETPLDGESVEIICGMSVARKSAHIDRGILLAPDRGKGIAVRRVEPGLCGVGRQVQPK